MGFVGGGVARALIIGVIVTCVSMFFVDVKIHNFFVIVVTLVLTSILFATAGLINGIYAKSFDDISVIPTFVLTPLTYLGGVFYSLTLLPEFWQMVSQANPIVYMVNGFRYGFLGVSDVNHWTSIVLLIVFNFVLLSLAYRLLKKGVGIRS
jgi:ABC-2 type transport system permease protein